MITTKQELTNRGDVLVIYKDDEPIGNITLPVAPFEDPVLRSSLLEQPIVFALSSKEAIFKNLDWIIKKYFKAAKGT